MRSACNFGTHDGMEKAYADAKKDVEQLQKQRLYGALVPDILPIAVTEVRRQWASLWRTANIKLTHTHRKIIPPLSLLTREHLPNQRVRGRSIGTLQAQ